ncbi:MAG: hypothetical protein HYY37_03275 [Candidatus Aenigmarchaeota archaeon]|nr:hypothetical protein [Candidatus Aenigmarchaeota archaeon]
MDLVVDANVLFSALIKEGITSELLFVEELHLYAPEYIIAEYAQHKRFILAKTGRSDEEFSKLLSVVGRRVSLVPMSEVKPFVQEAENISPDPDDTPVCCVGAQTALPYLVK